jgi:hypothetical protein
MFAYTDVCIDAAAPWKFCRPGRSNTGDGSSPCSWFPALSSVLLLAPDRAPCSWCCLGDVLACVRVCVRACLRVRQCVRAVTPMCTRACTCAFVRVRAHACVRACARARVRAGIYGRFNLKRGGPLSGAVIDCGAIDARRLTISRRSLQGARTCVRTLTQHGHTTRTPKTHSTHTHTHSHTHTHTHTQHTHSTQTAHRCATLARSLRGHARSV